MTIQTFTDDGSTLHGVGYTPWCPLCGHPVYRDNLFCLGCVRHHDNAWDEYRRRVENTLATVPGKCAGCGCLEERCCSLWPEQKKCCPDCSHGAAREERAEPGRWLFEHIPWNQIDEPAAVWEDALDDERAAWAKLERELSDRRPAEPARAQPDIEAIKRAVRATPDTGAPSELHLTNIVRATLMAARQTARAEEPKAIEASDKPLLVRCTFCNDEHPIAVPPAVGSVHYFSANGHFICEVCVDICAEYLSGFRENQQSGEAIDPLYQLLLALNRIAARGGIWADETAALIEKLSLTGLMLDRMGDTTHWGTTMGTRGWTKLDPQDPKTYPESGKRVDFVAVINGAECNCRGERDAKLEHWFDIESDGCNERLEFTDAEVTHWQPLPALPGEETERDQNKCPFPQAERCPNCNGQELVRGWRGGAGYERCRTCGAFRGFTDGFLDSWDVPSMPIRISPTMTILAEARCPQ